MIIMDKSMKYGVHMEYGVLRTVLQYACLIGEPPLGLSSPLQGLLVVALIPCARRLS
jgi:hypothetical protein